MLRLVRDVQTALTALCGLCLVTNLVAQFAGSSSTADFAAYGGVLFGSYFALKKAFESLRARSIDVDFLMVFAAVGAVVVGHADDAAILLFLFSLSSTMESLAMSRTKSAIEGLVRLRPSEALRVSASGDERVPVEALAIGDIVRVLPFSTIPIDGSVEFGTGSVDQSAMTGESIAVAKSVGDPVLGGTQNLDTMLHVRVSATVGDSTLDKIVSLVAEAQENKASGERISHWFGQRYTFFVLGAFAVSLVVRLILGQPYALALYEALVLLVALSPCALVISAPATTLSALAWAARHGMLIRGGEFIEIAGTVDTVALDKTGTLTTGRPKLVEICLCETAAVGTCGEHEGCWHGEGAISGAAAGMLAAAAALEQYVSHPIADAVVAAAKQLGVRIPEAVSHRVEPGMGVAGSVGDRQAFVGKLEFLVANGVAVPDAFREKIEAMAASGTPMAMAAHAGQVSALAFSDSIRPEAEEVLSDLEKLGVRRVVMLTGDNPATARRIGSELGIADVRAGLLPADKASVIQELVRQGSKTLMVGDGINDAPALTNATLGVAMGGLGSDIALNSADVVLMHDRLERIPDLIRLGRRTNRIIRANLVFAAGMILTLTFTSLFFKLPLPIAVMGHEGSTVLVILNGLRLLRGPRQGN